MPRICKEESCEKNASFGIKGKNRLYCGKHKKNNMINVTNPICIEEGCRTNSCFNNKNEKKGIFCSSHKKKDMINIHGKTCVKHGCNIGPSFNFRGETIGLFCKTHAHKEMINVKDPTCKEELCNIQPCFNFKEETIGLFCKTHAHKEMINVVSKRCNSCDLFRVLKVNNYLCSYCDPESSKRQKTKELQIAKFLTENSIKFINNKQFQNDCCLKYRPDFLVECATYYIIIEVDENAHRSYEKECEIIRMNNISSAIGLPVKFIRYNPDNKDYKKKEKEKLLLETIKNNSKFEYIEDISPIYLFY
jgi:hypothetical protein